MTDCMYAKLNCWLGCLKSTPFLRLLRLRLLSLQNQQSIHSPENKKIRSLSQAFGRDKLPKTCCGFLQDDITCTLTLARTPSLRSMDPITLNDSFVTNINLPLSRRQRYSLPLILALSFPEAALLAWLQSSYRMSDISFLRDVDNPMIILLDKL